MSESKKQFIIAMAEWIELTCAVLFIGAMNGWFALIAIFLIISLLVPYFGEEVIIFSVLSWIYRSIKLQKGLHYLPYKTLHRLVKERSKEKIVDEIKSLYLDVNKRAPDEETLDDIIESLSACTFMINPKTRRGVRAWLGAGALGVAYVLLPGGWMSELDFVVMVLLFLYGLIKVLQSVYDVV